MDDLDSVETVNLTKSCSDSGCENGFLSDSSSSSSKSDNSSPTCLTSCIFKENAKRKIKEKYHNCDLKIYSKSGHCIETLSPRTFLYLGSCVRVLDLSKNNIKLLPETISELHQLEELNLSCNELFRIPDSCKRLNKLQILNMSQNKLTEPPLCLELGMENLRLLDLSMNYISSFANSPKCSSVLQNLNLSHNCFNDLPLWLFSDSCRSTITLNMSFNYCFDSPTLQSQIMHLKHHRTSALKTLKELRICNTGFNLKLVSPITNFESLKSLHMGNISGPESTSNNLTEFPVNLLYNPGNIIELHLPKLGLAGLPEDIDRLKNLEVLDVSDNLLDWLPETFGTLKSLKELKMSNCNLAYLPSNFNQLQNLRRLSVDHNKLEDVKSCLIGLSALEWLDLYDNALEELPFSFEHLQNVRMVDLALNYINLEAVLNVEVNGENLYEVYCHQQARLREANGSNQTRRLDFKVQSNVQSWESLESLHKLHHSDSFSDLSELDYSTQDNYKGDADSSAEENWDVDSNNKVDMFEPDSITRYPLPLGQFHFGWTPPVKRKECLEVPINQQVSGFVYVPGQLHQKTTTRKRRKNIKDLPVDVGQFDDSCVGDTADLQKAESLGVLFRKMHMFVRNPAGLRSKRRCRFHGPFDDCVHRGLWYQLSPAISFTVPNDSVEHEDI